MKPFFSYLGSKYLLAKHYGAPEHPIVIEPFAGSAAYCLYHNVERAILYDLNPRIVAIWRYLISVRSSEVRRLPIDFKSTDDLRIAEEAKYLIGFWINKGASEPCKQRSAWAIQYRNATDCKVWNEACRERIASQVDSIRRWRCYERSF